MRQRWEPVIGLEVHVQLATDEKIFCGCPNRFGGEVNRYTCPVCLGMPGVLPVLNHEVVEFALRIGHALGFRAERHSVFARKNYFYPDLPKGYQITQYERPILIGGHLDIDVDGEVKRIGITRAHLEEDAGKSLHSDSGGSRIDLNRAGVPLLEIVSEPDLRSADEAVAYLKSLHEIVRYLGVCDGNMEEGSFRCDANVSIRPVGQGTFGTRAELKNLNTFKGVHRAIEYEIARHIDAIEHGGEIVQETRLWDDGSACSRSMRSKEEAHDYRYFPEPDLPPLVFDDADIDAARRAMPELPAARRGRLIRDHGLSVYDAGVLTCEPAVAEFFDAAVAIHGNPKAICNWITSELLRRVAAETVGVGPVSPAALARLVALIDDGTISGKIAKKIFEAMVEGEGDPDAIIEARGLRQVADASTIEPIVREIVGQHPRQAEQYRSGKTAVKGFFMGQVMKTTRGKANPRLCSEIIERVLQNGGEG